MMKGIFWSIDNEKFWMFIPKGIGATILKRTALL